MIKVLVARVTWLTTTVLDLEQLALYDLATAPYLANVTLPLTLTVCGCDPIEFELESGL